MSIDATLSPQAAANAASDLPRAVSDQNTLDRRCYSDGITWEQEVVPSVKRARSLAWIIASMMSVIAIMSMAALLLTLPLKTYEPYLIAVDRSTGFLEVKRESPLDLWAYQKGVILDFSRPGKPTDNAFIESFNGKFRMECLNAHWFMSLDDARAKMEDWLKDYNEVRPHSAIGNKTPV